jgi:hypothetical protein
MVFAWRIGRTGLVIPCPRRYTYHMGMFMALYTLWESAPVSVASLEALQHLVSGLRDIV